MSSFLDKLALAVQKHEGWYPGSRSWRNNNPGNLRNGHPSDSGAFTIYPTYQQGFAALKYDLTVKTTNKSNPMTSYYMKNNITYDQAVFLDLFKVYAPSSDSNNPLAYCNAVCASLSDYKVTPQTPMNIIGQYVKGEPIILPSIDSRIKGMMRRAENTKIPDVRLLILRVLSRLKNRL